VAQVESYLLEVILQSLADPIAVLHDCKNLLPLGHREDQGGLTLSLNLTKGARTKKKNYFGLFQGIFLISLNKFRIFDRKYEFKIWKKNHVRKIGFAHRDKRGVNSPQLL